MHYSSTVSMQFTSHKLIKRVETLQEKQDLNTRCVFYPKAQKLAVPRIRPAGRQRPQTCGATQPGLAAGSSAADGFVPSTQRLERGVWGPGETPGLGGLCSSPLPRPAAGGQPLGGSPGETAGLGAVATASRIVQERDY